MRFEVRKAVWGRQIKGAGKLRIVGGVVIINLQIVTGLGRQVFLSEFFYGDHQGFFWYWAFLIWYGT